MQSSIILISLVQLSSSWTSLFLLFVFFLQSLVLVFLFICAVFHAFDLLRCLIFDSNISSISG